MSKNSTIHDNGQVEQLHIKAGQFLLIHSNLFVAEGGSSQQCGRFLGSTNKYPITHICIKSLINDSHDDKVSQNKAETKNHK